LRELRYSTHKRSHQNEFDNVERAPLERQNKSRKLVSEQDILNRTDAGDFDLAPHSSRHRNEINHAERAPLTKQANSRELVPKKGSSMETDLESIKQTVGRVRADNAPTKPTTKEPPSRPRGMSF
jgi:hypothetical protein